MKKIKLLLIFIVISARIISFPIYIVTGASDAYFSHLLNLIGSLHKVNFDSLQEISVFDLGLTQIQRNKLSQIEKVVVRDIEKTHPDILTFFEMPRGGRKLGWYAWKIVAIKQSLDLYPYVIWLDAATTVLKPMDDLAEYVANKGYFLCTIGDGLDEKGFMHNVGWGATSFTRAKFGLETEEKKWILEQESVMGGIVGIARHGWPLFGQEWYDLTYDLRNFADDGTTPSGFGTGRHDQVVISSLAYSLGLTVHKQSYPEQIPFYLEIRDSLVPFYINWYEQSVDEKTILYSSRGDLKNYNEYYRCIKFRSN